MAEASLMQVKQYFGMTATELKNEWAELSEEDRKQFKQGIGDGTLTY